MTEMNYPGKTQVVATILAAATCAAIPAGANVPVEISNGILSVAVSPHGAELLSAKKDGFEYLWQQEPGKPSGFSPVLFPICGSLLEGKYTFDGREYALPGHGFASRSDFQAERATDGSRATFTLESNDATRAQYPFDFSFAIVFRLDGAMLHVEATVRNNGATTMPFAYGGHPGIAVPLGGDGAFEDFFLEFAPGVCPDAFEFGKGTGLITGHTHAFPLADGNRLHLRHELFNGTGLFLDRVGSEVTLRSEKSPRSVTVRFPDMPYLGLWHSAKTDTKYLCIEPWSGLPSYVDVIDDFATRPHMERLAPGASATLRYSMEFR